MTFYEKISQRRWEKGQKEVISRIHKGLGKFQYINIPMIMLVSLIIIGLCVALGKAIVDISGMKVSVIDVFFMGIVLSLLLGIPIQNQVLKTRSVKNESLQKIVDWACLQIGFQRKVEARLYFAFNAFACRKNSALGQPFIFIGIPLVHILNPGQLVGVIFHEVAHLKNRDNISTFLEVLTEEQVLKLANNWTKDQLRMGRWGLGAFAQITTGVMRILAAGMYVIYLFLQLANLKWKNMREYSSDIVAASIVGINEYADALKAIDYLNFGSSRMAAIEATTMNVLCELNNMKTKYNLESTSSNRLNPSGIDSGTHPSTRRRIEVINSLRQGKGISIVELPEEILELRRHVENNLENLIRQTI